MKPEHGNWQVQLGRISAIEAYLRRYNPGKEIKCDKYDPDTRIAEVDMYDKGNDTGIIAPVQVIWDDNIPYTVKTVTFVDE